MRSSASPSRTTNAVTASKVRRRSSSAFSWRAADSCPGRQSIPGGGPYGPYRQSDRLQIYRDYAEQLLREHKAYLCFCSEEELEADRQRAIAEQKPQLYSGKCRALDPAEAEKRRAAGELLSVGNLYAGDAKVFSKAVALASPP